MVVSREQAEEPILSTSLVLCKNTFSRYAIGKPARVGVPPRHHPDYQSSAYLKLSCSTGGQPRMPEEVRRRFVVERPWMSFLAVRSYLLGYPPTFANKYVYRADKRHPQIYFTCILHMIPGDLAANNSGISQIVGRVLPTTQPSLRLSGIENVSPPDITFHDYEGILWTGIPIVSSVSDSWSSTRVKWYEQGQTGVNRSD